MNQNTLSSDTPTELNLDYAVSMDKTPPQGRHSPTIGDQTSGVIRVLSYREPITKTKSPVKRGNPTASDQKQPVQCILVYLRFVPRYGGVGF